MSVRAVVAREPGGALKVEEIELPEVAAREVRVEIRAAGVCHSDLSMINGTFAPSFPLVLGHEAAGLVAAVGADVSRVRVGDQVVLNWAPPCRHCWFCEHGEPWLCAAGGVPSAPRGALVDGTPAHMTLGLGALAEQIVVLESAVVPVPDELPLESAALLGCAVLTGFGAVHRTAAVAAGESVAVIGLGGVGLAVMVAAASAGADPIVAIDVSESKRDLALAAGATEFIVTGETDPRTAEETPTPEGSPRTTVTKQVRGLTGGLGVDHAFECVGRATTIRSAWRLTRRGGACTIVGIGRQDDTVEFNAAELFHSARTLRSSVYGSSDPDVDLPELARAVLDGSLDPSVLVTDTVGLDGAPAAFDRMRQGIGARTLVTP